MVRSLRATAIGLAVLIEVSAALTSPRPGLSGDRLGVLFALVGIVLAVGGVVRAREDATAVKVGFLALLVAGSTTLVWLQPNGPGYLGAFLAVAMGAWRLPSLIGAAATGVTLAALTLASALHSGSSFDSVAPKALGVVAFYLFALLGRRFREGQEQARRLLIELEQSQEALAQTAALAERQHLAREMHDVLAHSLSGLLLQLEGARLLAAQQGSDPELAATVERAHRLAKSGLEEARRAIGLLRDDALPGPERLDALVQSFATDSGTRCTLKVSGEARVLNSEARLTLYRVAQEALTNTLKHATPNLVELHLTYEPDGTRLTVEDFVADGQAAPASDGQGYGLTGMRERAELLGGELTATPTASGFRVELWVPQ